MNKKKLDAKALHAAGMELLRLTESSGFVALVARSDGRMAFMEFGQGPITGQQRVTIDLFRALLGSLMDEGEVIHSESGPDHDKQVTIQ